MHTALTFLALLLFASALCGCASSASTKPTTGRWAIVLHGGAGVLDKVAPPEEVHEYENSLFAALTRGRDMLSQGAPALDVVEAVVVMLEDDPRFNAGRGAVFTAEGRNELDASIMDGATLKCGGVVGVTSIKNPIKLAREVMQKTRHVLLAREGAEAFASTLPHIERVEPSYYFTQRRWDFLLELLKERGEPAPQPPPGVTPAPRTAASSSTLRDHAPNPSYGTVGCVALDARGNLAAATSTGGMTGKRWARVGDSPIIGAGNYAANDACAISGTGTGEEFIRHGVARTIADRMRFGGQSLHEAASDVVFKVLKKDDGGVIGVSATGDIVMLFNSDGMFRGAADSQGRFEIGIWEKTVSR
jgi:beta-aspartyl-peptidase (threonine type)